MIYLKKAGPLLILPFWDPLSWHSAAVVRLQLRKRSTAELASCNETQTSETKCTGVCWSNYPISEAYGGTIPHQRRQGGGGA